MKRAFTLIELLVVIGIIAVLSGILFSSFRGGTESARAAKCLSNMRNLAQGAISAASKSSHYPYAGSHAVVGMDGDGKTIYYEQVGWISWLSKNDEYGTRTKGKSKPTNFVNCPNVSAYFSGGGEDTDGDFALQNGKMWTSVGRESGTYVCPEHQLRAAKKKIKVRFSYVMNADFGYDSSKGSDAVGTKDGGSGGVWFNDSRLDRKLLFAELPIGGHVVPSTGLDKPESDSYSTGADPENDCVLQYKASVDGKTYNDDWKGTAEAIAFNHKSAKRRCAHVVFADGHAEKLLAPKQSGGLNDEQLTALLCAGKDIGFSEGKYSLIKDGNED